MPFELVVLFSFVTPSTAFADRQLLQGGDPREIPGSGPSRSAATAGSDGSGSSVPMGLIISMSIVGLIVLCILCARNGWFQYINNIIYFICGREGRTSQFEWINKNSIFTKIDESEENPFITGMYSGYYCQYGKNYPMSEFKLKFKDNQMINGNGCDCVGDYNIYGFYSNKTKRMALYKEYIIGTGDINENVGHTVEIRLQYNTSKDLFEGNWYVNTHKYESNGQFIISKTSDIFDQPEHRKEIAESADTSDLQHEKYIHSVKLTSTQKSEYIINTLIIQGTESEYIHRALYLYEKYYGLEYDIETISEIIYRLQVKDKLKQQKQSQNIFKSRKNVEKILLSMGIPPDYVKKGITQYQQKQIADYNVEVITGIIMNLRAKDRKQKYKYYGDGQDECYIGGLGYYDLDTTKDEEYYNDSSIQHSSKNKYRRVSVYI